MPIEHVLQFFGSRSGLYTTIFSVAQKRSGWRLSKPFLRTKILSALTFYAFGMFVLSAVARADVAAQFTSSYANCPSNYYAFGPCTEGLNDISASFTLNQNGTIAASVSSGYYGGDVQGFGVKNIRGFGINLVDPFTTQTFPNAGFQATTWGTVFGQMSIGFRMAQGALLSNTASWTIGVPGQFTSISDAVKLNDQGFNIFAEVFSQWPTGHTFYYGGQLVKADSPPPPPPPPPPPSCTPPQIVQGNACVAPSLSPFVAKILKFANAGSDSSEGYSLSFDGLKFVIELPIYIKSAVSGVSDVVDKIIRAINSVWSAADITDQYGHKYDFEFNVKRVNDPQAGVSTIYFANIVGATNPACRSELFGLFANTDDCNVPKVNDNQMWLYSTVQQFCYLGNDYTKVIDCQPLPNAEIIKCMNADGSLFLDSTGQSRDCYDFTYAKYSGPQVVGLPFIAAHEFGHLLGLPDEYPFTLDPTNIALVAWCKVNGIALNDCGRYKLCFEKSADFPLSKCEAKGIMDFLDFSLTTQERYYDYVFEDLTKATPGFNWTFGFSGLGGVSPPPDGLLVPELFELPFQAASVEVPAPPTLALFAIGFACLYVQRRRRRD